jgi:RNA polymerase sigma-70 factor (ECF subfamily)
MGPGLDTPSPASFPSTQWSGLLALNDPSHPAFQTRFADLVQRYWTPAFTYVRHLPGMTAEEALDVTQEFFTRLLEKGALAGLSPERGSFRAYLKAALRNFTLNSVRDTIARRPREGRLFRVDPADWDRLAPTSADVSPDEAFDREWAHAILRDAVRELERALEREGKALYFSLFQDVYLAQAEDDSPAHESLARKHGIAPHDVANHLRHARALLRRILLERVRDTLDPGEDPERELAYLLSR